MKIRTNYVSNSSSSSFIIKDRTDLKYFEELNPYRDHFCFEVNQLKLDLQNIIKKVIDHYFEHDYKVSPHEMWELYMKDNVPDYFEYSSFVYNLEFLDFSSIIEFIRKLPENGYLTDAYDRDIFSEYCRIPYDRYVLFDTDL